MRRAAAESLRSQSWVQVDLVYDIDGLTILHDGWSSWSEGVSTEHLQIPGWNPQRGWRFGLGASAKEWTDYHWIDNHLVKATRYNGKFTDLIEKEVTIEVFDDGKNH